MAWAKWLIGSLGLDMEDKDDLDFIQFESLALNKILQLLEKVLAKPIENPWGSPEATEAFSLALKAYDVWKHRRPESALNFLKRAIIILKGAAA